MRTANEAAGRGAPRPRPGRARALTLALAAALALAACGEPDAAPSPSPTPARTAVSVLGSAGEPPRVELDMPLEVTEPRAEVVWPGTGPVLEEGSPVLLDLHAVDGRDGTVLRSTYGGAPQWSALTDDALGSGIVDALRGQRVGARVLYVERDGDVPVVLVVDVLPARATGETVPPVDGVPTVTLGEDGAPTVTVPADAPPPADLGVQPLIRGDGPQVEAGQVVTVRYTGVRWSSGEVFDTTWGEGSAPLSTTIGVGQVIEGWDQGLLEQTVGSQVLLVVPPELGYGGTASPLADETLVFVVDILDARFPTQDEADPDDQQEQQEPS